MSSPHRILSIPELLFIIFASLPRSSTLSAALVCHFWADVALDALWNVVDRPERLFKLLGTLRKKKMKVVEHKGRWLARMRVLVPEVDEPQVQGEEDERIQAQYDWGSQHVQEWNDEHKLFSYTTPLTPDKWARFDYYAHRVRTLVYDHPYLSQSAFDDIVRTEERTALLPNLHTLVWAGNPLSWSTVLIHKGVKSLTLGVGLFKDDNVLLKGSNLHTSGTITRVVQGPSPLATAITPILSTYFTGLSQQLESLTSLSLRSTLPVSLYQPQLISLLTSPALSKSLRKLTVPRFYYTAGMFEALGNMEKLEVMEFQYYPEQGIGRKEDVEKGKGVPKGWEEEERGNNSGAGTSIGSRKRIFPALYDMSLTVDFEDARGLLRSGSWAGQLSMFYVDSETLEEPKEVQLLLTLLAERCRGLTTLSLISLGDATANQAEALSSEVTGLSPSNNITLHNLQAIFDLPLLTSFEIAHRRALFLSQKDVEIIARALPNIEKLILNNEPVQMGSSSMTLEALLPFAKRCKKLRHLGLFVDGRKDVDDLVDLVQNASAVAQDVLEGTRFPRFQQLEQLAVGVSIIDFDQMELDLERDFGQWFTGSALLMAGPFWPELEIGPLPQGEGEGSSAGAGASVDHNPDFDDSSDSDSSRRSPSPHQAMPPFFVSQPALLGSPIATFLSYVLPLPPAKSLSSPHSIEGDNEADGCRLFAGVNWPDSLPVSLPVEDVIHGRSTTWSRVAAALHNLFQAGTGLGAS